jgi:hypothetical protein
MAATIETRYGGDSIRAGVTAVHITTAGDPGDVPANDESEYDPDAQITEPPIYYYFSAEKAGQDDLVSQVFGPNPEDGNGEWQGLIFPAAGTWTVHVRNVDGDTSLINDTVTVV